MAKQIRNMSDLIADVQMRLDKQDASIMSSLKHSSGKSFVQMRETGLKEAANALKEFLTAQIQGYYSSYSPTVYDRTGRLGDSVMVDMISINEAKVYFDSGMSYGASVFGGSAGYKPALISSGWAVSKGSHRDIYRFGYYEGYGFIEKAIAEAQNDSRFDNIDIVFNGYA